VNFGRVYCDFFGIYILFLNFLRHQTMDKVQKYNSFDIHHVYIKSITTQASCYL